MSQPEITILHNFRRGRDKFYAVRIDVLPPPEERLFQVVAAWGTMNRPLARAEQIKGKFNDLEAARDLCMVLAIDKRREGYLDVDSGAYAISRPSGRSRQEALDLILAKLDMSRCLGTPGVKALLQGANSPPAPSAPADKSHPRFDPSAAAQGRNRSRRIVDI